MFAIPLRKDTAGQIHILGPFISDTDFKTPQTGLTINANDILIRKAGAASVFKNNLGATDNSQGCYSVTWDATDTNTEGEFFVSVALSGSLIVIAKFFVQSQVVFDALSAAGAPGYGVAQTGDVGVNGIGLSNLGGMSGSMQTEIQTSADAALVGQKLDHLIAVPVSGGDVVDASIIATMVSKEGPPAWSDFNNQTASLQALSESVLPVRADTISIMGTLLTQTTGDNLADNFSQFYDLDTTTTNTVDDVGSGGGTVDANLIQISGTALTPPATPARLAQNFSTFYGNLNAVTTKTVDEVGAGSGSVDANVTQWNGIAVAAPGVPGVPDVNVAFWKGIAAEDQILLSDILSDEIALQTTLGVLNTVNTVADSSAQSGDNFARIGVNGAGLTNINLPDQTMNITGNLTGSVNSVLTTVTANAIEILGAPLSNIGGGVLATNISTFYGVATVTTDVNDVGTGTGSSDVNLISILGTAITEPIGGAGASGLAENFSLFFDVNPTTTKTVDDVGAVVGGTVDANLIEIAGVALPVVTAGNMANNFAFFYENNTGTTTSIVDDVGTGAGGGDITSIMGTPLAETTPANLADNFSQFYDLNTTTTRTVDDLWTAVEKNQQRFRLGLDGTTAVPSATPNLGTVASDLVSILGTAVTNTLGNLATNISAFYNVAAVTTDVNDVGTGGGGSGDLVSIMGTNLTEGVGGNLANSFTKFFDLVTANSTLNDVSTHTQNDVRDVMDASSTISSRIGVANDLGAGATLFFNLADMAGTVVPFVSADHALSAGGAGLTVGQIVDGVWNALNADHTVPGSQSVILLSAGASSDPWLIDLVAGGYTGNQAGKIVEDALVGHTPQGGDSFGLIGPNGSSLSDLGGMSTSMTSQVRAEVDASILTLNDFDPVTTDVTVSLIRPNGIIGTSFATDSITNTAVAASVSTQHRIEMDTNSADLNQIIGDIATLPTAAQISVDVWTEVLAPHSAAGNAAEALIAAASGGSLTVAAIVDGVWDEVLISHTVVNSGAALLKQVPVDIAALPTSGDIDALPTALENADAVWDEEVVVGHTILDSAGQVLVSGGTAPTLTQIVNGVWNEQISSHAILGSTGLALADVSVDIGNLNDFDPASETVANVQNVASSTLATLQPNYAVSTVTTGEVNAEMLDVLTIDQFGEPGQVTPPEFNSIQGKIDQLYKRAINRKDQDAASFELFDYAGAIVDQKAVTTFDGTTSTKAKLVAGP